MLIVYVDDILVLSEAGEDNANSMFDELGGKFEIKKLGKARHILGFEIHQGPRGILIEQNTYAESILDETNFSGAKIRSTLPVTYMFHSCGWRK